MRTLLTTLLLLLANAIASAGATAFDRNHGDWATLLARHAHWNAAGTTTTVDYAGFAKDRNLLDRYLGEVKAVSANEYGHWPKAERNAFLIDAYNAATVRRILERYPRIKSIKDLGGWLDSPWKKPVVDLLGKRRSLDEIEHDLLRGAKDYSDPRIHFAVNCASIGCPALRPEPYTGVKLDVQLDDQTRRFLRDRSRNRYDTTIGVLSVSHIFDWYGEDFVAHAGGVNSFLARYPTELGLDAPATQRLRDGRMPVRFLDYDWSLNGAHP